MKTVLAVLVAFLASTAMVHAAGSPTSPAETHSPRAHRVVFEVASAEPKVWNGVLNNLENLRKALGADTQVEVVVHGNGLGFLLATNRDQAERMKQLADAGVVFAACRNTMHRQKVTAEQLFPFATTVDSGVAEVVRRQEEGWAYLRTGE